jgi:hypothetical protein
LKFLKSLKLIFYGDKCVDHLNSAIKCVDHLNSAINCVICVISDKNSENSVPDVVSGLGFGFGLRGLRGNVRCVKAGKLSLFLSLRGLQSHLKVHLHECFGHTFGPIRAGMAEIEPIKFSVQSKVLFLLWTYLEEPFEISIKYKVIGCSIYSLSSCGYQFRFGSVGLTGAEMEAFQNFDLFSF